MRVREVIRLIEADGWYLVATKGSHRQYKHREKPGRITVAGHPGDGLAPGTVNSIYNWQDERRTDMHRCLVVIEKADGNYSAYSPDLPGCVATRATRGEVEERMREAIAFHLDGLREDGLPLPDPQASAAYVAV